MLTSPDFKDLLNLLKKHKEKISDRWQLCCEVVKISDDFEINFIGREDLIKTKEAAGRPQDLIDLKKILRNRSRD